MDRLLDISEFVLVANLENRAINAGINKAQDWWKNRHNHNEPINNNNNNNNQPKPKQVPQVITSSPIGANPGQLIITVLSAQDLHESRLSMITGSSTSSERPYVVIECNQQRFQTKQADSNSTNRNPQWTSGNGPFSFNIFNPIADRLTVWIQQQELFRVMKHNDSKMLGMCEISVSQLIGQERAWLPLRKYNKPVGQVLLGIEFIPKAEQPPPYRRYDERYF